MSILLGLVAALMSSGTASATAFGGPEPRIELYTMGQGDLLFERYGHAALCVVYDEEPFDSLCYNYGTTDFDSPPHIFGWRFMRGTQKFWVSVSTLDDMLEHYRDSDRSIWVQRLPLSRGQAEAVAAKLADDELEENRYYLYHHFDDNCSTRLRDIIDDVTLGALSRDSERRVGVTIRELGRRGVTEMTGLIVISDFMLGRDTDVEPTVYEAMFLPDVLREVVEERLGVRPELIYERAGRSFPIEGSRGKGWILLIALLVAAPTLGTRLAGRRERLGLGVSAVVLALAGAVLWFIAIISQLPELRWNEAVLVFWPSDFLLIFFGPLRRRDYARVRVIALLIVSVALAVGIFRQPLFTPLLIPLLPMLAVLVARR